MSVPSKEACEWAADSLAYEAGWNCIYANEYKMNGDVEAEAIYRSRERLGMAVATYLRSLHEEVDDWVHLSGSIEIECSVGDYAPVDNSVCSWMRMVHGELVAPRTITELNPGDELDFSPSRGVVRKHEEATDATE